jgi:hypothetical protein
MRYTKEQARREARKRTRLGVPHTAVKTRYWCMRAFDWQPCWTVVLGRR